jgi:hypothetical protein
MDFYFLPKVALLEMALQCCELEDHKHVATRQLDNWADNWTSGRHMYKRNTM